MSKRETLYEKMYCRDAITKEGMRFHIRHRVYKGEALIGYDCCLRGKWWVDKWVWANHVEKIIETEPEIIAREDGGYEVVDLDENGAHVFMRLPCNDTFFAAEGLCKMLNTIKNTAADELETTND